MKLLIKGGQLIDPASGTDKVTDILIEDGVIKEISPAISMDACDEIIDASRMIVSPGFIDIHVHLREPGQEEKEDIETGSRAAVHGGFTSIVCMPNTSPVNDGVRVTRQIIKRAQSVGLVNVFPVAAATRGLKSTELAPMEKLVEAGARGFSDDGRCVMDENLLRKALVKAKELQVPFMEHAEDHNISQDGQVNTGAAVTCNLDPIPPASEDLIIQRDIRVQEDVRSYLHLTHISTEGAVHYIKKARKRGIAVTSDVTPHHLLFDERVLHTCDPMYKMKPPLRSERDREAMVEGLVDGTIDCIATDHAPHTPEEKSRPFQQAPFGVIGMETAFPVIYDRFVRTGIITLKRMIEVFSTNPAKVMHLDKEGRGTVKIGGPADLTILNLEKSFRINAHDFYSKADNCPFIGWEGRGVVEYTIVNGEIVYDRETGL